jgi:hypothetical protein
MEIETVPVTFNQRIDYLKQIAENRALQKKPFPWTIAITSVVIGAGLCIVTLYILQKKKEKEKKTQAQNDGRSSNSVKT